MKITRNAVAFLVLASLTLTSCRASRWKKGQNPETGATALIVPKRIASTEAPTNVVQFEVDEKSGRPRSTLVVRLDYFPEPRPGSTNLPACFEALPPDFEIGSVQCADKPGESRPLTAKNVDQDCYTNPKMVRVTATQPLSFPGCRRGQAIVHAFTPTVRVDSEVRDIN